MRVTRWAVIAAVAAGLALAVAVAPTIAASGIPANLKLCKGFEVVNQGIALPVFVRSDGSSFANYSDCATYAAHGGAVIRRSQFVCESFGGTYIWEDFVQTGFGKAIWTCRNFTVIPVPGGPPNFIDNFPCEADGFAAGFESISIEWTVIDLTGSGNVMECRGL